MVELTINRIRHTGRKCQHCSGKEGKNAAHLSNQIQTFPRADVPFAFLFHFCKYPRLNQGTTSDHNSIYTALLYTGPITFGREAISTPKDGYRWHYQVMSLDNENPKVLVNTYSLHLFPEHGQHRRRFWYSPNQRV